MIHKDEYKHFVKDKKKREKHRKKGTDVELQQTTLTSIVERHKSYSASHPGYLFIQSMQATYFGLLIAVF